MEQREIKYQEKCKHEFIGYKQCCYCGIYENSQGAEADPYVGSDMHDLNEEFRKYYFGIKEENGKPPLAMQIFYWFSQRVRANVFEYEKEIKTLEGLIELKEKERKSWADLCIRKQTFIESMYENATLGNMEEVLRVLKDAVFGKR